MTNPLGRMLAGPALALPRPLDAVSEWWAARPPRLRAVLIACVLLGLALGIRGRVDAADARWGGEPVPVLVAVADLPVGAVPGDRVELRPWPPVAVPPGALAELDDGAALALAAPAGTVLTTAHVDARGPAAGLDSDLRAVPVPAEEGWGLVPGTWVDVWVLGGVGGGATADGPATVVAHGRPVLDVRVDGMSSTALIGLAEDEVAAATAGLAVGRLLLTHAPPPEP